MEMEARFSTDHILELESIAKIFKFDMKFVQIMKRSNGNELIGVI